MKQKSFLIILAALIVVAGVVYGLTREGKAPNVDPGIITPPPAEKSPSMDNEMKGEAMLESVTPPPAQNVNSAKTPPRTETTPIPQTQPGKYIEYSEGVLTSEQKAGSKVVLFFHATWCPECRAADAAFKSQTDLIPPGVTVLKTDYDTYTALKKKYAVAYQHTFVQIDSSGNQITKWVGGDVAALKKNIK